MYPVNASKRLCHMDGIPISGSVIRVRKKLNGAISGVCYLCLEFFEGVREEGVKVVVKVVNKFVWLIYFREGDSLRGKVGGIVWLVCDI